MAVPRLLTPGVWMIPFPVGNAYLWAAPGGLALFDTGVAGSDGAILDAVSALGIGPLRFIVLSHYHDDHRGSAAALRATTGARVIAHGADAPVIRGDEPQATPNLTERERALFDSITHGVPVAPPCDVDREVKHGEAFPGLEGARFVHAPGHTPGSLALLLPAAGVLFTGDCIASVGGQPILGPFNVDRQRARQTFRELAGLAPSIACSGHGEPLVGDAAALLQRAASTLPV